MTKEHKYAKVLRWIADGEQVQIYGNHGLWVDRYPEQVLCAICDGTHPDRFRIKPRTILVNGVEVPAPETEAPKISSSYFLADPSYSHFTACYQWGAEKSDFMALERGLVYLNKEDAIARAKAMLITQEC